MNKKGMAKLWTLALIAVFTFLFFNLANPASIIDIGQGWNGAAGSLSENNEYVLYSIDYSTSSPKSSAYAISSGDITTLFSPAIYSNGADHPVGVQLNKEFPAEKVELRGIQATEGILNLKNVIAICQANPREIGRNLGGPYDNPPSVRCRLEGNVESDSPDAKFYGISSVHIEVKIYKDGFEPPTQIQTSSQIDSDAPVTQTINTQTLDPVTQPQSTAGAQTSASPTFIDKINQFIEGIIQWFKNLF